MVLANVKTLDAMLRGHAAQTKDPVRAIIQPNPNPRSAAIALQTQRSTRPQLFSKDPHLSHLYARVSEQTTYGTPRGITTNEHTWRFGSPAHAYLTFGPYHLRVDSRWRDARPPEETHAWLSVEHAPTRTQQDIFLYLSEALELRGITKDTYQKPGDKNLGPQLTYLDAKKHALAVNDLYESNQNFHYRTEKLSERLIIEHEQREGQWEFSIEAQIKPDGLFGPKITSTQLKRIHHFITNTHDDIRPDKDTYTVMFPGPPDD